MLVVPLVYAASRLAFRLARGAGFDAVAFLDLTMVILIRSFLWSSLSPPGSAARRWASVAILVAFCSLTLGDVWCGVGPPTPEAVLWCFAAFGVAAMMCFAAFGVAAMIYLHLFLAQVAQ